MYLASKAENITARGQQRSTKQLEGFIWKGHSDLNFADLLFYVLLHRYIEKTKKPVLVRWISLRTNNIYEWTNVTIPEQMDRISYCKDEERPFLRLAFPILLSSDPLSSLRKRTTAYFFTTAFQPSFNHSALLDCIWFSKMWNLNNFAPSWWSRDSATPGN